MARSPGRTAVKEAKKGHGSRVFNIVIIWVATIYLMSLVFNIQYLQSRAIYKVSFDVSGINPYAYIPGVANLSILGFLQPLRSCQCNINIASRQMLINGVHTAARAFGSSAFIL